MRKARRMLVVRMVVGMMVRSSTQADQSVTLRQESQPLGVEVAGSLWLRCPASVCDSESFSRGHGITAHAFKCGRRPTGWFEGVAVPSST